MAKVLSLINQKGGVGKTATAVNLAAALGESGERVLLIDFDPQGNTTSGISGWNPDREATVYELIAGQCKLTDCLIEGVAEGVDLIPADIDLSGGEAELQSLPDGQTVLRETVAAEGLRERYDYILIDCPPSLGALTVNALSASDAAIIPVQCEYYAMEGLSQVLNTIDAVRERFNPALKVAGILFTMYDARTRLSDEVCLSVREHLAEPIFDTVIPRNVRLAEAPSHGEPITTYDAYSRGAESYRHLAAEILSMQ